MLINLSKKKKIMRFLSACTILVIFMIKERHMKPPYQNKQKVRCSSNQYIIGTVEPNFY